MKSPSKPREANLDSLLDTMTNVVGVLVLMLATAFLSMPQIVEYAKSLRGSDVDSQIELEKESIRNLELELEIQAQRRQLMNANSLYASRQEWLEVIRKRNPLRIADILEGLDPEEEISSQLDVLQQEHNSLLEDISQMKLAVNNSVLPNTQRDMPEPTVTIARVPDPIPAPIGAKRTIFFCRYGRITKFDERELGRLENRLKVALTHLNESGIRLENYQKLIDYFAVRTFGPDGFSWKLSVRYARNPANGEVRRELRAYLIWDSFENGETLQEIHAGGSNYRRSISSLSQGKNYAKFYVWNDSFPEYVVAREIADSNGFPGGWVAQEGDLSIVVDSTVERSSEVYSLGPDDIPDSYVVDGSKNRIVLPGVVAGYGGGGGVGTAGVNVPSFGAGSDTID